MNQEDFETIEIGNKAVARAALEVGTANASLSGYKFHGSKIEANPDPDTQRELSESEQDLVEKFRSEHRFQVEAIVREAPATEGMREMMNMLATVGIKQVIYEISGTMTRIRNAVKVYGDQSARINTTLKKALEQLKRENPKKPLDLNFEFGAYSRFFHIGDIPCNTLEQFMQGIYAHRASSEWSALHAVPAIKEVFSHSEKVLLSLNKSSPFLTAAISEATVERAGETVLKHMDEELRLPLSCRGLVRGSPDVPPELSKLKDVISVGKGLMFDASVLCVVRPSKAGRNPTFGAIVMRYEKLDRVKVKGYEFSKMQELISLIEHGIEITSNTRATLDELQKVATKVLAPLEEAMVVLTKRLKLHDNEEKNYMVSQAYVAKLLCSVSTNPLLSTTWLDLRLARMIAGMVETYFQPDPSKRLVFKQTVNAA